MNLFDQISTARRYMPELLQYVRELMAYERQTGFEEAAELWLPAYDDDDEVIGLERISGVL